MGDSSYSFCGNSSVSDSVIILNGSYPKISECFQNTYMVWIPFGLFWLFLPNYISLLSSIKDGVSSSRSRLTVAKTIINGLLCLLMVTQTSLLYIMDMDTSGDDVMLTVNGAIKAATFVAALAVGKMADKKGISTSTSGFMFLFWLSVVITGFIPVYTQIIEQVDEVYTGRCYFNIVYWILAIIQFLLHCFGENPTVNEGKQGEKDPCPEIYASFSSKLSFSWMNSLISRGYEKPLTAGDIWEIRPQEKGENVISDFEAIWNQELQACERYNMRIQKDGLLNNNETKKESTNNNNDKNKEDDTTASKLKKPSMWRVLFKMCGKDVSVAIVKRIIFDILQLSNPILLGMLITFIQNKSTEPAWKGYGLACSFYLNFLVTFALVYNNDINMDSLMLKVYTALSSAIYKKAIRINNKTKKTSTVGELVNLMSVDAARMRDINWNLMFCFSVPFRFLLCVYLLWSTLGSAVLAGMSLLLLLFPLNYFIGRKEKDLHQKLMDTKDARSKVMSEIINGIKVLKFYVWEPSFEKKVNELREEEMAVIKQLRYIDTSRVLVFGSIPFLVAVVSFAIYIFYGDGHYLDAGTAFTTLSLFDSLKWPMYMLPAILQCFIQKRVSMKRICDFLESGELDPENVQHKDIPDIAVKVEDGTFSWDDKMEPTLQGINLEIPKGQLIAIVGQVGMGKSSLLSAFLGEMDKLKGSVNMFGSVGYVPQQAWIQNAKLKDNILFGNPLDQEKYDRVVDACSLRSDLDILAAGDNTEIGEKGINLSGGQKQRVNLARAVYYNADIYLMDDPLSAVDSHVGKHIFDEVIGDNGLLKNKTRVLVTHGVHWLPKVDNIVVMKDGKISEMGTYAELLSHDGDFSQFLKTYHHSASDQVKEDSKAEDTDTKTGILESKELIENIDEYDIMQIKSKEEHCDLFTKLIETLKDEKEIPSSDEVIRRRGFGRSISSFDNEFDGIKSFEKLMNKKNKSTLDDNKMESELNEKTIDELDTEDKTKQDSKQKSEKEGGTLIDDEETETGQVKFDVLKKYFQAYGYVWLLVILMTALLKDFFSMGESAILTFWTEDPILKNTTLSNTTEYKSRNLMYIAFYAGFGLGDNIFDMGFAVVIFLRNIIATRRLHGAMLKNILRCPMSFFDTTPVARILKRFTADLDKIDHGLPHQLRGIFLKLLRISTTLFVICYNTPLFVTVVIPAAFLYRLIQKYFITSIRQIERLHSKTHSPVLGHFGETVSGVSTIRAYGLENTFIQQSQKKIENHVMCFYTLICAHKWLGLRLEAVSNLFVLGAAVFAVMSPDVSGSVAGLCVAFTLQITGCLNGLVHDSVRLETNAIGVERITDYIDKETEAPLVTDKRPSSNWPINGNINIQNYQTRYRPGLDLVLRGINCDIKGGEKVGVVGRTGAGKSSLMSALFRLIESADGKIEIDGMNIAEMGLHDLRSHLTILPQDPVLFSGTLRMNLDPFENYSTEELWTALEHAHLKKFVSGLQDGLKYECGEGGQNLSVGQRQLVCLARALLHKTKILILDEATAAVDMETDDLIQKTIRTEFKDSTILAIAHRLNTIMDYDKVLVLGQGLVLEYDAPENLLKDKQSVFYGMAKHSNIV